MTESERADEVSRLLTRLRTVPEVGMRVALWREFFETKHPNLVLEAVQQIIDRAKQKPAEHRPGLLALSRYLTENDVLARKVLLPAAVVAGDADVISLVVDEPAARVAHEDELTAPLIDTDRDVTLGERRSLARQPDRDLIGHLVLDPDPLVIRNLLQNPRLIELDVLRIASQRPARSDVLREVFQSKRWSGRRSIQLALIQNPYTPTQIGLSLVELCDDDALREVILARSIHPLIIARARERVRGDAKRSEDSHLIEVDEWTQSLLERRDETGNPEDD